MHKVTRDQRNGTSLGVHIPIPTDEEDTRIPNTGVSCYYVIKLIIVVLTYVFSNVGKPGTQGPLRT